MNYKKIVFKFLVYGLWMVGWMVGSLLLISYFIGPVVWWNFSPSAPEGIYIYAPDQTLHAGDWAIVKLPVDVPPLHKGHRMLKQVQGFPSEVYEVTESHLVFRNRNYPVSGKKTLPHLLPGTYVIEKGSLLFLNNPDISFDSRYLGQISKENVLCKAHLLFTFNAMSSFFDFRRSKL